MKIFRFFANNKCEDSALFEDMSVATLPDTALLIQKRPFFVPDFTQDCRAVLCACVRINRLGRSIGEQFANRYYDKERITLAVHFTAADLMAELATAGRPVDLAVGFDNAVAVAETGFLAEGENLCEISLETMGEEKGLTACVQQAETVKAIDREIARVSQHYTMRQGDLLLLPLTQDSLQAVIDSHISLRLNNTPTLTFNIK